MDYEKIIVELLSRIQTLEEQVTVLTAKQENKKKEEEKMTTNDICEYINELKRNAKECGKIVLVLRSGDIHKDLGLRNAMPQVCNAMRHCMRESDIVLHTTPSGYSCTIEIEYKL
ncbi:MAG: hypothetical protein PUC29_03365 [Clostridia bacterium]|nr:hypothetical protein [Clostridia bacterium]